MQRVDDDHLDAVLARLTEPGEDAGLRARVIARLEEPRAARSWHQGYWPAVATLAVTVGVAAAFWWPARLGPIDAGGLQTASARPATADPFGGRENGADAAEADPANGADPSPSTSARPDSRSRSGARSRMEPPSIVATSPDEGPLPFGMERVRVEPVTTDPVRLEQLRDDPALAAMTAPVPVSVEPIDIAPVGPRR